MRALVWRGSAQLLRAVAVSCVCLSDEGCSAVLTLTLMLTLCRVCVCVSLCGVVHTKLHVRRRVLCDAGSCAVLANCNAALIQAQAMPCIKPHMHALHAFH